jgi:hypothetical protein
VGVEDLLTYLRLTVRSVKRKNVCQQATHCTGNKHSTWSCCDQWRRLAGHVCKHAASLGSAWTVVAHISSMFLMKQGIYSYMYVLNVMHGLWDIRIFRSLVPKESPCIYVPRKHVLQVGCFEHSLKLSQAYVFRTFVVICVPLGIKSIQDILTCIFRCRGIGCFCVSLTGASE